MTIQATTFETLRDLVLYYGARRGWSTQRHIAVACGLDESALSRFLNGEQDIGARRTHALFREVGVPVDQYDLAYALLGRAQDLARTLRQSRAVSAASRVQEAPPAELHAMDQAAFQAMPPPAAIFPVAERALKRLPPSSGPPSPPSRSWWARFGGPLARPDRSAGDGPARDLAALARAHGLEPGADVPAAAVVALFAVEGFTGEEIERFFQTYPPGPFPLGKGE